MNIQSQKKDIWIRKKSKRDENIAEIYINKLKKTFFKSVH